MKNLYVFADIQKPKHQGFLWLRLFRRHMEALCKLYLPGSRTPKADLTAALAEVLNVSPHALSVPDIDSYVGLMHTLFTLEDNYGLKVTERDGELALQVDFRKNKDAAQLHEMLWTWREQSAKLEAGEISQEEYDRWRYHYPEYDSSQIRAKMPPESLI